MKKRKINLNLLLVASAIAGAAFIYSCTQEELNPSSSSALYTPANSSGYTPCTNVGNTDNPYDQAGVAHNAGLEHMYNNRPDWACGGTGTLVPGIAQVTANFLCDNGYSQGPDCYNTTVNELTNFLDDFDYSDPDEIISNLGSEALQAYMHELIDEVDNYEDSTQIDTLLASIKQIEAEVMASSLSTDEKETFLGSASVARYSACYWFQEHQKALSDWAHCPGGGGAPLGKIKWGNVAWVVGADILGFAATIELGGVGGGIAASGYMAAYILTH